MSVLLRQAEIFERILAVQIDDEPGHLSAANVEQLSSLRPHLSENNSLHSPCRSR